MRLIPIAFFAIIFLPFTKLPGDCDGLNSSTYPQALP